MGVLLLNKYLLSSYGFKYPIFLTMCHMTSCSLLSYVAIAWMRMVPMQTVRSRVQLLKIAALSLVFCVSVVFGNISLRFLPVSFNQAIGATTPFFTAVFAYLITLKREAWLTYVTLVPVVTGVVIASGVMEKLNSMNLLLYMAPIAVVFLLSATLIMEKNVVGITIALARDDFRIVWCSSSGGFDSNIQESCLSDWNVGLLAHGLRSYPLQRSQEAKQMTTEPSFYLLGPSGLSQAKFHESYPETKRA
ncbi:PREDICTED: probable sugar phosphate/phosphate translocator At3g11320 isoform X3 [Brassica oleracea var. oleracea]|uniref:probable sugar phosphate/phosphate translocator At3g11320 isoform X3 n=1 Tax=Brassica oleracea var. oleracea TaxID=109376 RepID=UPI0006A6C5DE|nr:PREDICTED: probable sugar phosphate/phosphate translocator At3g11320 isoform X3 [Brassica oleracea var. oleracea]